LNLMKWTRYSNFWKRNFSFVQIGTDSQNKNSIEK
jgi:hypothetical protein